MSLWKKLQIGFRTLAMAAAFLGAAGIAHAQGGVMTRHVRSEGSQAGVAPTGTLPAQQQLTLDLVLPLSDPQGLDRFLTQLYDPSSSSYRQFLTPAQFSQRFGPSAQDYAAVVAYAKANEFTVVGGSLQGMNVTVRGSVQNIQNAFHLTLRTYQHPTENRQFYAPDREPTHGLGINLWHISGLDNYSLPKPRLVRRDTLAQALGVTPQSLVPHATTGSGPSASYLGSDMRAAYYGSGSLTGAGQTIGLLEYYGTNIADLQTYFQTAGHADLSGQVTLVSTDATSTSCVKSSGCDDTEQTLDITQALGMAPAAKVVMYVGSSDTAIIAAMTAASPLPLTIGCSWGWSPVDPSTLDPYFKKMATQGQTFLAASGDHSTWTISGSSAPWPADDPYVVSVGGTDLVTTGAAGSWSAETAWVDSGGGISPNKFAIPAWQQLTGVVTTSNKASSSYRNGPDIAANANFTFYVCANQTACTANAYGGTSFAAPMWAGYLALLNQQLLTSTPALPAVGFLNPTIYALNTAANSKFATDFHDVTSGTSGSYSATTGYDLVTGWGSPSATLLSSLTSAITSPTFSLSASPTAVSVAQGSNASTKVLSSTVGGFSSAVTFAASGLPTGVTASFSPATLAGTGSVTLTLAATSSATPGTSIVTVTGTPVSGTPMSMTVSLTVTLAPTFTLKLNPTSLTVTHGTSQKVTVTDAWSNGTGSVGLKASGLPNGLTASFSPTSISGNGSSTLTLKASSTMKAGGPYTVTITGTSGSLTRTQTVAVTIN